MTQEETKSFLRSSLEIKNLSREDCKVLFYFLGNSTVNYRFHKRVQGNWQKIGVIVQSWPFSFCSDLF